MFVLDSTSPSIDEKQWDNFVAFVNMAQQALDRTIEYKLIMKRLKEQIQFNKFVSENGNCEFGQTKNTVFEVLIPTSLRLPLYYFANSSKIGFAFWQ